MNREQKIALLQELLDGIDAATADKHQRRKLKLKSEEFVERLFGEKSRERENLRRAWNSTAMVVAYGRSGMHTPPEDLGPVKAAIEAMQESIARFEKEDPQAPPDQAPAREGGISSTAPSSRPRLFVGSSTEGLRVAETIQLNLDHNAEVTVWTQGVFAPSSGSLASLVQHARSVDFAVLVLSADDLVQKRAREVISPRDNVIFELGLFMGALGSERVFMVHSREQKPELPSDLGGITALTYAPHSDGNLQSALGAACTAMRETMTRLGVRPR